jgi:hypothetical protein
MFPLLNEDKDNPLEIFQVWLNLPKVSKMVAPHFKMLWNEDIPIINHQDKAGKITTIVVIAGRINETNALDPTPDSWAAKAANAVGVYTVKMDPNAEWTLPKTSADANRSLFFYKGENIAVETLNIGENHILELSAGENITIKNGKTPAYFLILEGKPINEPVVQHGPFVMNTRQEINQAISDYQKTQFGGWPWSEREVAHDKNKGRFAVHSDGREDIK